MTISITRYVDIVSGLGAVNAVTARQLVGRFFTANPLLPPQTMISFTTAAEVGTYFGLFSEEYLRSLFYFSWTSKNLTTPPSIQFARWTVAAVAPTVTSIANNTTTVGVWTPITAGSFVLTMGAFTFALTGLDFSEAGTLAAVATVIEDAIQAETGGGTLWTAATVTYSSTHGFVLTGGATGAAVVSVAAGGGGTDITASGLLGWLPQQQIVNGNLIPGALWSNGGNIETITQTLTSSAQVSNNFGSFAFLTNLGITQQNVVDAATWNDSQNVLYLYSQAVLPANVATWQAAVAAIGGIALTISPAITQVMSGTLTSGSTAVTGLSSNVGIGIGMPVSGTDIPTGTVVTSLVGTTGITLSNPASGSATVLLTFSTLQFPEMMPQMIEAATNYSAVNSVQNYEYQQFAGITPSVSDDATANTYDSLGVNYYGVTQQAGQQIAFYQQGWLQGQSTDIRDMNAYVNEIWLKDAATVALMNLLLAVAQVPANNQGRNLVLGITQGVINNALNNGTISVGKTLTTAQQLYITSITNDALAWYQVQNSGYWIDCVIASDGATPPTYTATYQLVYSKDDVIRKINGTHTLI